MVEQSDNLVEIYSKPPTQFLANNWQKLLPSWKTAPQTLVITLLKSEFSLEQEGDRVAQEKDRLLKEFLSRGKLFYSLSQEKGYLAEVVHLKMGHLNIQLREN
jgi:hypothetical protein